MKKFGIALLGLLVVGLVAARADTVTVTNRGRVFTINVSSEGTNTVPALDQAARLQQLKVTDSAVIGNDLGVLDALRVWGPAYIADTQEQAVGNRSAGYFTITDLTNLSFIVVSTNGATAAVALSPHQTNVVVYGITP